MLNLLLLEDVVTDAELIIKELERSGMDFCPIIAQGKKDYIKAIKESTFDAILADNTMPQFSAAEALEIYKQQELTIPFILVTGSISEEFAVEIMKLGAYDYILKDRMQRLPSAIYNAINKCNLDSDRKKYLKQVIAHEALLKEAAQLAQFGSWDADMVTFEQRWSDEQYHILGYSPGEIEPSLSNFLNTVHPEDLEFVKQILDGVFIKADRQKYDCRIIDKNGTLKYINGEMAVKRDEKGKATRLYGFIRDRTEAMNAEMKEKRITADLLQRNKDLEQFAYIISHNLRAPVANIVGVTNVLVENKLTDQEKEQFMTGLSFSVQKLDNIIVDLNHILQVKNNVNENKELVSFAELVNEVKLSVSNFLNDNCIMISCDFEEVGEMMSLKSYMRSIFYNLISNSIKFKKPELAPVIEIKSRRYDDKIELTFKDNSIGIDLEKKSDQIFGLYKRFHPEYAQGKGMGLFMVKTQVETLGGKITVKSRVNEGTEFKIIFDLQHSYEITA
jgi:signal transduction histidine kinase/CheY-like chemotaxis protein